MSGMLVIYNAKSGGGNALKDLKQAFAAQKLAPDFIDIGSRSLMTHVRKHQKLGSLFVAAGGDGTVNAAASFVRGTKCTLGIIPLGTLNHFAKELDIPLDENEAVKVIAHGHHRTVDVGEVNDHVFVNNSSIGLYPRAVITRDNYKSRFGKWPAALFGMLRALMRPHRYHIELHIDGRQETIRTPFVFIGNNEYQRGQLGMGQRASLDGGILAIYVLRSSGLAHVPRLLVHGLFSKRRRTRDFTIYRTDACTISIHSKHTVPVACDGEVFQAKAPLSYKLKPHSLNVLVPHAKK